MRAAFRVLAAATVALSVACASHRSSAAGDTKSRTSPNEITYEQIQSLHVNNAFDAVQALHSNWLSTRGTDSFNSPSQVWVYLDDTKLGGVETLRDLAPASIGYIQHFDGVTATARWGLNHGAGVIYVSSRRKEK